MKDREKLNEEKERNAKRRKLDNSFPNVVALDQTLLDRLWRSYEAGRGASGVSGVIEIEARIGMLLLNEKRRWTDVQKSTDGGASCIPVTDKVREQYRVEFFPGIDDYLVSHLNKVLGKGEVKPVQRIRIGEKNARWEVDSEGNGSGERILESKKRIVLFDFALRNHHYDLRLDVNSEVPIAAGSEQAAKVDTSKYVCERVKRRIAYTPGPAACAAFVKDPCCWKVDLTYVDSTTFPNGARSHSVELEFELLEGASRHWLGLPDTAPPAGAPPGALSPAKQFTRKLSWQLQQLLNACIPCELEQRKSNVEMLSVVSPNERRPGEPTHGAITQDICRLNEALCGNRKTEKLELDFPGSMPVNLVRRNFSLLETNEYFVTEKSDGVRYLMYVVNVAGPTEPSQLHAVVMDRAKQISLVLGSQQLGKALGAGTVLDGELIFHKHLGREVYLIFDILSLDGEKLMDRPFSQRLAVINNTIVPRISTAKVANSSSSSGSSSNISSHSGSIGGESAQSLMVFPKQFFPKREITRLVRRFRLAAGGEHIYVLNPTPPAALPPYGGNNTMIHGMLHKSDGIVFQPDTPYQMRTDTQLLKWKWLELASVDLLVTFEDDVVRLYAGGVDGQRIECTQRSRLTGLTNVPQFDSYRLWADVKEFIAARPPMAGSAGLPCIVEVSYSSVAGGWHYHCIRSDKTIPNNINTVMSVFMELADDISIEELEYTLLARSAEEKDYASQISKMKTKLLTDQRDRVPVRK